MLSASLHGAGRATSLRARAPVLRCAFPVDAVVRCGRSSHAAGPPPASATAVGGAPAGPLLIAWNATASPWLCRVDGAFSPDAKRVLETRVLRDVAALERGQLTGQPHRVTERLRSVASVMARSSVSRAPTAASLQHAVWGDVYGIPSPSPPPTPATSTAPRSPLEAVAAATPDLQEWVDAAVALRVAHAVAVQGSLQSLLAVAPAGGVPDGKPSQPPSPHCQLAVRLLTMAGCPAHRAGAVVHALAQQAHTIAVVVGYHVAAGKAGAAGAAPRVPGRGKTGEAAAAGVLTPLPVSWRALLREIAAALEGGGPAPPAAADAILGPDGAAGGGKRGRGRPSPLAAHVVGGGGPELNWRDALVQRLRAMPGLPFLKQPTPHAKGAGAGAGGPGNSGSDAPIAAGPAETALALWFGDVPTLQAVLQRQAAVADAACRQAAAFVLGEVGWDVADLAAALDMEPPAAAGPGVPPPSPARPGRASPPRRRLVVSLLRVVLAPTFRGLQWSPSSPRGGGGGKVGTSAPPLPPSGTASLVAWLRISDARRDMRSSLAAAHKADQGSPEAAAAAAAATERCTRLVNGLRTMVSSGRSIAVPLTSRATAAGGGGGGGGAVGSESAVSATSTVAKYAPAAVYAAAAFLNTAMTLGATREEMWTAWPGPVMTAASTPTVAFMLAPPSLREYHAALGHALSSMRALTTSAPGRATLARRRELQALMSPAVVGHAGSGAGAATAAVAKPAAPAASSAKREHAPTVAAALPSHSAPGATAGAAAAATYQWCLHGLPAHEHSIVSAGCRRLLSLLSLALAPRARFELRQLVGHVEALRAATAVKAAGGRTDVYVDVLASQEGRDLLTAATALVPVRHRAAAYPLMVKNLGALTVAHVDQRFFNVAPPAAADGSSAPAPSPALDAAGASAGQPPSQAGQWPAVLRAILKGAPPPAADSAAAQLAAVSASLGGARHDGAPAAAAVDGTGAGAAMVAAPVAAGPTTDAPPGGTSAWQRRMSGSEVARLVDMLTRVLPAEDFARLVKLVHAFNRTARAVGHVYDISNRTRQAAGAPTVSSPSLRSPTPVLAVSSGAPGAPTSAPARFSELMSLAKDHPDAADARAAAFLHARLHDVLRHASPMFGPLAVFFDSRLSRALLHGQLAGHALERARRVLLSSDADLAAAEEEMVDMEARVAADSDAFDDLVAATATVGQQPEPVAVAGGGGGDASRAAASSAATQQRPAVLQALSAVQRGFHALLVPFLLSAARAKAAATAATAAANALHAASAHSVAMSPAVRAAIESDAALARSTSAAAAASAPGAHTWAPPSVEPRTEPAVGGVSFSGPWSTHAGLMDGRAGSAASMPPGGAAVGTATATGAALVDGHASGAAAEGMSAAPVHLSLRFQVPRLARGDRTLTLDAAPPPQEDVAEPPAAAPLALEPAALPPFLAAMSHHTGLWVGRPRNGGPLGDAATLLRVPAFTAGADTLGDSGSGAAGGGAAGGAEVLTPDGFARDWREWCTPAALALRVALLRIPKTMTAAQVWAAVNKSVGGVQRVELWEDAAATLHVNKLAVEWTDASAPWASAPAAGAPAAAADGAGGEDAAPASALSPFPDEVEAASLWAAGAAAGNLPPKRGRPPALNTKQKRKFYEALEERRRLFLSPPQTAAFLHFATPAAAALATSDYLRTFGIVLQTMSCPVLPAADMCTLAITGMPTTLSVAGVSIALTGLLEACGYRALPRDRLRPHVLSDGRVLLQATTHLDALQVAHALRGAELTPGAPLQVAWVAPQEWRSARPRMPTYF